MFTLTRLRLGAAALLLCAITATPAAAQLRPVEPLDWRVYETPGRVLLSAGGGILTGQPAPLAGSKGTLLEVGSYRILWRTGRMALDLSGTSWWRLHEDTVLRSPDPAVTPAPAGVRHDAGPVFVGAAALLTPAAWPAAIALRFNTRIPTTSDESGLERDRTDFTVLLSSQLRLGAWSLLGEVGAGINGARPSNYPQSDALVYALGVERSQNSLAAFARVVGQQDGLHGSVRGNEDRSELRLGARYGRRWWLEGSLVRGLAGSSPTGGFLFALGTTLDCRADCLPH